MLAAGCFRRETPADVTIINYAEPDSLDPAIIVSQPDMRIVRGLFEGLARLDPKTGEPIPGLAEKWEISPDAKTYTFHLRTNLVWSTGEPITADDVVYSWLRVLNPLTGSDYANSLFYLKNAEEFNAGTVKDPSQVGIHALDKQTVQVELNSPTPFFIDICTFPDAFVVPKQTIEKYGDRWIMARPLPSSGPFELEYWRLSDRVRLKKSTLLERGQHAVGDHRPFAHQLRKHGVQFIFQWRGGHCLGQRFRAAGIIGHSAQAPGFSHVSFPRDLFHPYQRNKAAV